MHSNKSQFFFSTENPQIATYLHVFDPLLVNSVIAFNIFEKSSSCKRFQATGNLQLES